MLRFKLVYSDDYYLPIGDHIFPGQKYRLVHQQLLGTRVAEAADFVEPEPATDDDVLLVHTRDYVDKLHTGMLTAKEELAMEIPYSPEVVKAFWINTGGSILAARLAMRDGVAINIGGGYHHAFPDHGEGFCMIHDVAIAIRRIMRDGIISRALVLDCDVHQGNGTAAIFGQAEAPAQPLPSWSAPMFLPPKPVNVKEAPAGDVFTISLHQENNYPAWKPPSSIDVNLPDRTGDAEYLAWLDNAITSGLRQFEPDLICYLAGADPYKEDQLGGLSLTVDGLKQRDEFVFRLCKERHIPVMVTYAGGYARRIEDTVNIHCNTVLAAKQVFNWQ
ncbi:MAG TPA: histone deacetylase [Terriglobales bacterium]|nr:histone deacetylase [Terriglobales bacterium]